MLKATESMRDWSARRRGVALAIYVAAVMALACYWGFRLGRIFDQPDAVSYLDLAAAKPVMMPFASRQLGPLLVRALSHLLHWSIERAYVAEGIGALLVFVTVTGWMLVRSGAPRWMLPAVAGLVFWALQLNALVMPDLMYAALLCVFLLLLRQEQMLAAALMMFPLTVSRESTMLTLVCFLLAGWRRLRWREVVAAIVALGAGLALVKRLAATALPNYEHLSPLLYMAAKMPWNLVKNVLGISPWANLYPSCDVPQWRVPVHLGPLSAIGFCGFDFAPPLEVVGWSMAIFGLFPLLLIKLRGTKVMTGGRGDVLLRFALIYGGISFVLAPLLGESLLRLFGYSWPMFVVALPLLLGASRANFRMGWAAVLFVVLHLLLSYSILRVYPRAMAVEAIAAYAVGWILLKKMFVVDGLRPA
jgi:hypothetical protein